MALVLEVIKQKGLGVVFLQETHRDCTNEMDCGLWWRGPHFLNHGSSLAAGVEVLLSCAVNVNILSSMEIKKGRALLNRAEIGGSIFCFSNIYLYIYQRRMGMAV